MVDSTICLEMNKNDAYLFRSYITELEYYNELRKSNLNKIALLERKNVLWESTAENYNHQLILANNTIDKQVELGKKKDEQHVKDLKDSHNKGIKKGAVLGAAITLILCLLLI